MRLFRPSSQQRGWINFAKTLLQTVVFWTIFLLILPTLIIALEDHFGIRRFGFPCQDWLGILLFFVFSIVAISSSRSMSFDGKGTPLPLDCPQKLVVSGPYAYVRNPMAITGLGQAIAVGIYKGSFSVITYAIAGGLIWHFTVRKIEEADLSDRFGEAYKNYQRAVKCWIPNFTPYKISDNFKS